MGSVGGSGNDSPRLWLGFEGGTIGSGGAAAIQPPNVQSISGPNYLYLNSLKIGSLTNMYLPRGATNLGGGNAGPQLAKIPINVQPGGIIYWQDPNPQNFLDMDELNALTELDLYLTLGNVTSEKPLKLNGGSFSIKLAILEKDQQRAVGYTGYNDNARIIKRMRPT